MIYTTLMDDTKSNSLLAQIDSPEDLKKLDLGQLHKLADEIRDEIVAVVSSNGGHLAPNLGVVELTIALHYIFNSPQDQLVWDVGHQAYVHKILTGRREAFRTVRQADGCLGFLSRDESPHDCFGAGHAGTAISAALGLAAARDRRQGHEKVIAIVGDGSLNCGISLEGLNTVAETTKDLIVILNDNKMSISPNVGAIPDHLNRIISGRSYNRFKAFAKKILYKIPHADEIRRKISRLEEATKSLFVPSVFFEELGFRYIGPIDGHDLNALTRTLEGIKEFRRPVIMHVLTEKGKGYGHAEAAPEKFHGLSSFDPDTGLSHKPSDMTFSKALGNELCKMAEETEDIVAITAAMRSGTGLTEFSEKHPDRFYDVGIAEEHAVVFAAGLAAGGARPVVAMYATFLQRALDCVMHDVCLQKLPVIFCIDRAGIVEDGPTHHGIHDVSFLRNLPGLAILSPRHEAELQAMLRAAYKQNVPAVIRYPRGGSNLDETPQTDIAWGKAEPLRDGKDVAIWAWGPEANTAMEVAEELAKEDIAATVINTRFLAPFDDQLLLRHAKHMPIVTIEDHQTRGGLASMVDELLINHQAHPVKHFGWGLQFIPHGPTSLTKERFGLTASKIAQQVVDLIRSRREERLPAHV